MPRTYNVTLQGTAFVDGSPVIRVGDTVRWVHADGATTAHTVTSDAASPMAFDSHPLCGPPGIPVGLICMVEGDEFSLTFSTPGVYPYACKVHPSMTGTITVEA
jgi:plastocyanin